MGAVRIIPALAGNTSAICRLLITFEDHPRTRGEHFEYCRTEKFIWGSSPHSRGTHAAIEQTIKHIRIIPALAGNTKNVIAQVHINWDHPRTRGEHRTRLPEADCTPGSSPHSRGTRLFLEKLLEQTGIIPALAGNTRCFKSSNFASGDHPRTRGEHAVLRDSHQMILGSSPHSRGTLIPSHDVCGCSRIIPALAGNTQSVCTKSAPSRDHPRTRGEHCQILHTGGVV